MYLNTKNTYKRTTQRIYFCFYFSIKFNSQNLTVFYISAFFVASASRNDIGFGPKYLAKVQRHGMPFSSRFELSLR